MHTGTELTTCLFLYIKSETLLKNIINKLITKHVLPRLILNESIVACLRNCLSVWSPLRKKGPSETLSTVCSDRCGNGDIYGNSDTCDNSATAESSDFSYSRDSSDRSDSIIREDGSD